MSQGSAAAATLEEANQFDIVGAIVISYSRSSFAGPPLFSYRDGERKLNYSGGGLTRLQTPVGELVTITLEEGLDTFVRTFTLVVPKIRLRQGGQVAFDTVGVQTTDRSAAFVRSGLSGALHTYCTHQLSGIAQLLGP